MTGASEPKAAVRVYQRKRDGQWVAAADTRELHAFAVVATERQATTAARYLDQMCAALKGTVPEGGLVLTRGEFSAARTVLDAMGEAGLAE